MIQIDGQKSTYDNKRQSRSGDPLQPTFPVGHDDDDDKDCPIKKMKAPKNFSVSIHYFP